MSRANLRLRCLGLAVLGATLSFITPAAATVIQPNGQTVPTTGRLQALLNGSAQNNNINENVNEQTDAQIQPEKFSPLCDFSGRYVEKGGGANFAVGWYNVNDARPSNMPPKYVPVDTGANLNTAAATSDIQLLFPFSSNLPPANMRDLASATIRGNARYTGGLIGFALVPNPNGTGNGNATQYHYTEQRFNTYCSLCTTPGYWVSTLIYKSNQLPNTFYLGFEDLDFLNAAGNAGVNGNDLDYEDFLFRFSGIACVGAGQPCTVATNKGACQAGVTECDASGQPKVCKAITTPTNERCDGIDNDCDGVVDNGATCPSGLTCTRGRCTTICSAEFPCPGNLQCELGRCIDAACIGVSCTGAQVCRNGTCGDPCTGVVCPEPTTCSGGTCIDPCTDPTSGQPVVCKDAMGNPDTKKVCIKGACITKCDCLPCGSGQACQTSTGKCVETACANVTCGLGDTCVAGNCVAACSKATCPSGQVCTAGKCVEQMSMDPAPLPDPNDPNNPIDGGGYIDTGCACRMGTAQNNSGLLLLVTGLFFAILVMRRRRA